MHRVVSVCPFSNKALHYTDFELGGGFLRAVQLREDWEEIIQPELVPLVTCPISTVRPPPPPLPIHLHIGALLALKHNVEGASAFCMQQIK